MSLVPKIDTAVDAWNFIFHDDSKCFTEPKRRLLSSHVILFGFVEFQCSFSGGTLEIFVAKREPGLAASLWKLL